jgi:hypothetical protein
LTLDGGGWSVSSSGRFIREERVPRTHGIEGWVGLTVGLDALLKSNASNVCREWNHGSSVFQPVAYLFYRHPKPFQYAFHLIFLFLKSLLSENLTSVAMVTGLPCSL